MSRDEMTIPDQDVEQHSLVKSFLLHLGPGFVVSVIYFIIVPAMNRVGIPPFLVLMGLVLLLVVPFELGYLLYEGKKKNGSFSLKGVVAYRKRMPAWQIAIVALILLAWVSFASTILLPLERPIIGTFFSWVPDIYFFDTFANRLGQYEKAVLLLTALVGILLNGLFGPFVEELYFRGYLLPRISRFGPWAPVLNAVLFALYHFFTPWQNLLRMVAFVPISYAVWWKKNIVPAILVHCIMNLIGTVMMLLAVLKL